MDCYTCGVFAMRPLIVVVDGGKYFLTVEEVNSGHNVKCPFMAATHVYVAVLKAHGGIESVFLEEI